MAQSIQETGIREINKDSEHSDSIQENSTRANGSLERCMEKELMSTAMEPGMRASGSTVSLNNL